MKIQPIAYKELKSKILQDEQTHTLYIQGKRVEELQQLLQELRTKAGLTLSQVAERMGVTQPAVSKLEKNASRASILTLQRYAHACGAELRIGAV